MRYIVGVVFRNSPKLHKYQSQEPLNRDIPVVIENSRGVTVGFVRAHFEDDQIGEYPEIIRVANDEDIAFEEIAPDLEREAMNFCVEKIEEREMKMKIVRVHFMLHSSKIIFYFTAEGRVDFRALVKDLAAKFRSRIEMRQIGVRDEAQMLGGIGICGREVCCFSFIGDFQTISLEDARENSFGVSNEKLIGICGRFMCCLRFEEGVSCKDKCSTCCASNVENQEENSDTNSNNISETQNDNQNSEETQNMRKPRRYPSKDRDGGFKKGEYNAKRYKKGDLYE
ncbi:stage 0 sporulation protein [bacterium]|nr:stage 0 sporulation protein [bacterium]